MPWLGDMLRRFRPAGAPGAAAPAGVPVDRRELVEAELEPVFAALAATGNTCAELRRVGAALARARGAQAQARADAMVAAAERDVPAVRAGAATRARTAAGAELAGVAEAATREAEAVRRDADRARTELVTRAVAGLLDDVATLGTAPGSGRAVPR